MGNDMIRTVDDRTDQRIDNPTDDIDNTDNPWIIRSRVVHAMTVPFTIQIVGMPWQSVEDLDDMIDTAATRIANHLHGAETRFSPFNACSLVTRARRGDWSALLNDPDFAEVYALCTQAKQLTDGTFDPMHDGAYDPTGIVKGWAIQRAHERILMPLVRSERCAAAALGGGGDIQTAVHADSDFQWRIGVQNPFAVDAGTTHTGTVQQTAMPHTPALRTTTPRTITLRNGAVATSGTYRRGEHITRTAHDLAQATVVDDHLIFADMWATAAISAGERRFRELTDPYGHLLAVLVRADHTIATIGDNDSLPAADRYH
ncbi:FAD:protein FMN transferase [Bifidobacterium tissieri]|uniref:FAD:protein FMN transferase n=2 Tax=Bifidobacterium tissieri TaxID=1630162 RepID=A0A5M9ZL92_9BIFI|nr:FAD:protein FMN transferase [Bifidobacterium tissieri]